MNLNGYDLLFCRVFANINNIIYLRKYFCNYFTVRIKFFLTTEKGAVLRAFFVVTKTFICIY